MKQQIIELKKKLLLVELPEGINGEDVSINHNQDDYEQLEFQYPTHEFRGMQCYDNILLPKGYSYKSIGKLTDITEIQCEEWVEWIEEPQYYIDYRKEGWQGDITAKESFFSYLESRGVVFENPLGEKPVLDKESLWGNPEQDTQVFAALNYQIDKWEEAESKIWNINQCYLFEILN